MENRPDRFAAFLRGINVGGAHKVPMAELKTLFTDMGYSAVTTLLNSGNVIFDVSDDTAAPSEEIIAEKLEGKFGFPIPVMLRSVDEINQHALDDPFAGISVTGDIRLYVSFLKSAPEHIPDLPISSGDGGFTILTATDDTVYSVLDLAKSGTVNGMAELERYFGKEITTRNWNTVLKIADKK
jgi:uncharacterized protein (DUF1697 family)